MRLLVFALVLAAVAKLGWQEYNFRSGLGEAVITAYRERAIKACQRDPQVRQLLTTPTSLADPSDVRIIVGRPTLDVAIWDLGNARWSARHRHPHLLLVAAEPPGSIRCAFDLVDGTAALFRS